MRILRYDTEVRLSMVQRLQIDKRQSPYRSSDVVSGEHEKMQVICGGKHGLWSVVECRYLKYVGTIQ